MKRIFILILLLVSISNINAAEKPTTEYYQLTVYRYATDSQALVIEQYLQEALLPALHRAGIKSVGVFKSLANDTTTNKLLYVFLPLKNLQHLDLLDQQLKKDQEFVGAGTAYRDALYTNPPYTRMEVILLKAFPLAPQMQLPQLKAPKSERVYELRSYESATEKIFANKVKMFNEGDEIGLFKRLNFNAVFYSSVIAGSKMPNLMYMTCFENKADRDEHWKTFSQDPYWKKLSSMPEYQKNVSRNDIVFLRPTHYSDF